jgi:HPt (histidine-containing phosphotransfer) domain-containing protein
MQSTTLRQLKEMEQVGGVPFVEEIIGLFFSECEMRFSKIEAALATGDLVEAGRLFHMIKGNAATTGTSRLYRISSVGEEAGEKSEAALALRACRLGSRELNLLKTTFKQWQQGTSK